MPPPPRKTPLEPLAAVIVGVLLLHILLGLVIWTLLPMWPPASLKPVWSLLPDLHSRGGRYWFSPTDFKYVVKAAPSPLSPSVEPKVTPTVTPPTAPKPAAKAPEVADVPGTLTEPSLLSAPAVETVKPRMSNKVITLSPVLDLDPEEAGPATTPRSPITLMEVVKQEKREALEKKAVGGADMDPVLKALEEALKKEWNAPSVNQVPILQRNARLAISVGRDGSILETRLAKASGSYVLDESVREAGERLKKITESLPSSFPKDRYNVEVNFHIE